MQKHWLKDGPEWLAAMYQYGKDWEWCSEYESRELAEVMIANAEHGSFGYPLSSTTQSQCADLAHAIIPLAKGPNRRDERYKVDHSSILLLDPKSPESPLWALDINLPSIYWFIAGVTYQDAARSISPYFQDGELAFTSQWECRTNFEASIPLEELQRTLETHGASNGRCPDSPQCFLSRWSRSACALEPGDAAWNLRISYNAVNHARPKSFEGGPSNVPVDVLSLTTKN